MPIQFVNPALTAAQSLSQTAGIGGAALTGQFGGSLLSPIAVGLGNYLRSDTGTLLKDRLRQGDIPGAFSAVTRLGRSNAPRLEQYNPPGFDPSQPVTIADLRKTLQETGPLVSAPAAPPAPVDPLSRLSPQDRAYQQERARVEAMVKSNPDMQKEEIAAARAKVRDEGMAIWAAKHKGLAKQVMPGQSGYETIQQTLYPGGTPVPTLSSESEAMLNVIAPANQQGVRPNVTPMPGQLPSFGSATEGMFNAITAGGSLVTPMPQELIEKYKEQLLKQAK